MDALLAGSASDASGVPSHVGAADMIARGRAYLRSASVVSPDGAVISWRNPVHDGYAYPEAGALLISLLADDADTVPLRDQILSWLARQASDGPIGKSGRMYVFDTCMLLDAVHRHVRGDGALPATFDLDRTVRFVADCIDDRVAVLPVRKTDPLHWSSSFAPHLLKCQLGLRASGAGDLVSRSTADRAQRAADSLEAALMGFAERGFPSAPATGGPSYAHAYCYALEGVWFGGSSETARCAVTDFLGQLCVHQRRDGGVGRWFEPGAEPGVDVTAQAIRLWTAVDPVRHDANIKAAVDFLLAAQDACGGTRYAKGCVDVNTWATVFAVQALEWVTSGSTRPRLAV